MRAVETELEQERTGVNPATSESTTAKDGGPGTDRIQHFSPDPLGDTDRYRLVTPYRLDGSRDD